LRSYPTVNPLSAEATFVIDDLQVTFFLAMNFSGCFNNSVSIDSTIHGNRQGRKYWKT